jgi:hypothetical protein
MILPVVGSAQGNDELVAGLSSHRARLGEPKMVGVSGASPANQARLRCDKLKMNFIAMSTLLADRELALVDFGGNSVGWKVR